MIVRYFRLGAAAAALGILTSGAFAVYQTNHFERTSRPVAAFDAKTRTWTVGNAGILRTVRFDAKSGGLVPVGLTDSAHTTTGAEIASEGRIVLVSPKPGGPKRTLDLSRGWTLAGHSERAGVVTILLHGKGANAGISVEARYRAFAGNEPVIFKRLKVTNNTSAEWLLAASIIDSVRTHGKAAKDQTFSGSGYAVTTESGAGFVTNVLSYQGHSEPKDGRVDLAYRPFVPIPVGKSVTTPEAILGLYEGPTETGGFLLQLAVGAHVSRSTPTTVPPLYSTWFGYYNDINEELITKLIPKAASIGAKIFSIDDGWQAIGDGRVMGYGDWIEGKTRFAHGLKPIAALARANGMKFGLWTAPIMVHNQSTVSTEHPEWKIKYADGKGKPLWDGTTAMCFSGAYAKAFSKTQLKLARELDLAYVKLDGGLFEDKCVVTAHGHPEGHSEAAHIAAFEKMCSDLRRQNKGIIISRGWEQEPGVTAVQDSGWFGDWAVAFRPEREADRLWWYKNADIYRRTLYDVTFTRPPFTVSWEAPCHTLAKPVDLNALEYHITSIGAWVCNMEIHGRILEMTDEEAAIVRKWVSWNWANRDFLAVTQPLVCLGKPYDVMDEKSAPHVDGVMHLRNALNGKYGYVCVWNPSDKPATADVVIRPRDYFVTMNTRKVALTRFKDGTEVKCSRTDKEVTLHLPMEPLSWEIVEVNE